MMTVGLYQNSLLASGEPVPQWMISGHAHLGVLSILAIVLGLAVPAIGVTGTIRSVVTGAFVVGQWGLPLSVWLGAGLGLGILHATAFVWELLLVLSMAIMAWQAAVDPADIDRPDPTVPPADD